MEPISFFAGHIAGKALDYLTSRFRTHVIERWSRKRAEQFFEEFCHEVEAEITGAKSESLDELLTKILEDETGSEVLFDAYRRVVFARSKNLGPRIIGILTAELTLQNRLADEIEDGMLSAAETLDDNEMLEFTRFVRQNQPTVGEDAQKQKSFEKAAEYDKDGNLRIRWCVESVESVDSASHRVFDIRVGPLDLTECLGRWASKLKSLGIISDDVKERQWRYEVDTDRHVDEPGTVREITWWISVPKPYLRFVGLIERVSSHANIDANEDEKSPK